MNQLLKSEAWEKYGSGVSEAQHQGATVSVKDAHDELRNLIEGFTSAAGKVLGRVADDFNRAAEFEDEICPEAWGQLPHPNDLWAILQELDG